MPKPKTKKELLDLSENNYLRLIDLVQNYSPAQREKEFNLDSLNRNIRDVITHLHEWHLFFQNWYQVGMEGGKPDMPSKGYTWRTLPALNRKVWEDYQHTSLEEGLTSLKQSYQEVRDIISAHNEDDLFEKKRYKWTGSTSLGAYLISNTSSHYDWAYKLIKKGLK